MDIKKFFSTLTPNMDRSALLRQLDETESNILNIDIPAITVANDLLGRKKFKSQAIKDFHAPLRHITKGTESLLSALNQNNQHMPGIIDGLRKSIKSIFSEKISSSGISYQQLNLLNMVEALDFYSQTSRTYLRWLYDEDAISEDNTSERHIAKAEVTQLLGDRVAFGRLIEFFNRYSKNIASVLDTVIDAVFDEQTYQIIQANHGLTKIDPANLFVVGVRYNIFWHIGRIWNEVQLNNFKHDKEEKQALELRVLRLKEIQAGQPSVETEKELTYVEDKLKRVKASIAEMEKKYAI